MLRTGRTRNRTANRQSRSATSLHPLKYAPPPLGRTYVQPVICMQFMQSARGAGVRARVQRLPYVAREPRPQRQARAPSPMRAAAISAAAHLSCSLDVTAMACKGPARQLAWARGRWRGPPTKGWASSTTPSTNSPGAEVSRGALPAAATSRRSR